MLLTRQKHRAPSPQLNMTPMIDCIFQLLIFFMCTASFMAENSLLTQVPGSKVEPEAGDFQSIRIALTSTKKGVLISCDDQACATFDGLVQKLLERRRVVPKPKDNPEKDKLQVLIEGQGTVPFSWMAGALDACHQADVYGVAFSIAKGGAGGTGR